MHECGFSPPLTNIEPMLTGAGADCKKTELTHMNTDLSPMSSLMAWVHLRPANIVHKATNVSSKPFSPPWGTSPVKCPSSKTGVTKNKAIASGLP